MSRWAKNLQRHGSLSGHMISREGHPFPRTHYAAKWMSKKIGGSKMYRSRFLGQVGGLIRLSFTITRVSCFTSERVTSRLKGVLEGQVEKVNRVAGPGLLKEVVREEATVTADDHCMGIDLILRREV